MESLDNKTDQSTTTTDNKTLPNNTHEESKNESETQKQFPLKIIYCPNCGLPPDYCENGPDFEKCKPWLKENFPQYYPHIFGEEAKANEANQQEKKENVDQKPKESQKKKVTIKEESKIAIVKTKRNKNKFLTTMKGLDKFNVPVKEAAKKFGKKFACGASVIEDNAIEIQGDIAMELIDYIMEEYPTIKKSSFTFQDKSSK